LNFTPETATVISLPYSVTLSEATVESAPTGTGYTTPGSAAQRNALWWKYTTLAGEIQLSFKIGTTVAGNYVPIVTIWTDDNNDGLPDNPFYNFTTSTRSMTVDIGIRSTLKLRRTRLTGYRSSTTIRTPTSRLVLRSRWRGSHGSLLRLARF
jgi:hypothetical protein